MKMVVTDFERDLCYEIEAKDETEALERVELAMVVNKSHTPKEAADYVDANVLVWRVGLSPIKSERKLTLDTKVLSFKERG